MFSILFDHRLSRNFWDLAFPFLKKILFLDEGCSPRYPGTPVTQFTIVNFCTSLAFVHRYTVVITPSFELSLTHRFPGFLDTGVTINQRIQEGELL